MSTYTQAQIAQIGKLLESASGGLVPAPVGSAWATAEEGINNNVFGLGASTKGVPAYPSLNAAVQATWNQLTSSGVYAATISRLQAAGGNVGKAALAIAESPWHLGAAGVKAAGGVDPYYARVFTQAGIPVSTSGGLPPASVRSGGSQGTVTAAPAAAPFIDIPDGHVLTIADAFHIVDLYSKGGVFDGAGGTIGRMQTLTTLEAAAMAHKVWGPELRASLQGQFGAAAAAAGTAVPDAIGGIVGGIVTGVAPAVVSLAVLVALLWVGKVGLEKTLG